MRVFGVAGSGHSPAGAMRSAGDRRRHRRRYPALSCFVAVGAIAGLVQGATLRPDAVCDAPGSAAGAKYPGSLNSHDVASAALQVTNANPVDHVVDVDTQCRLVSSADHLKKRLLVDGVWADIAAARKMLPVDAVQSIVNRAPGMIRLAEAARAPEQDTIVGQVYGLLVGAGGDVTVVNNAVWCGYVGNVLHWAIWRRDELIVQLLLSVPGIDVHAGDNFSRMPLHNAIWDGQCNLVKMLLNAPGVDVNRCDTSRMTPLHTAVMKGNQQMVELLLMTPGIDVNARDGMGDTPLGCALFYDEHPAIIRLLQGAHNASTAGPMTRLSGWLGKLGESATS